MKRSRVPKEATSVRLTPEARRLWQQMAEADGVTQAQWMERQIRQCARRRGIRAELADDASSEE